MRLMVDKIHNVPPKAKLSIQRLVEAASGIESPRIVRRWALAVAAFSSLIAIILALALIILLPLKQYEPYFVVERPDGSVVKSDAVGAKFVPSERNLMHFAASFITKLLTIDEQMRFNLPSTYELTRGAAVAQWRDFVQRVDRPQARLQENPTLRRSVVVEGTPQLIAATREARTGSLVFFLRETTVIGNDRPVERRVRFTLDYILIPPENLQDALKNPIGFYVTGFRYEPLV